MHKYQRPVTPAEFSAPLASLCAEIASGATPQYVDVVPLNDAPANECFPLVTRQAEAEGGELVIGWSLWELPTLFVEAEFHAIWRSPTKQLLDITPKNSPTQRILFLLDGSRQYEGRTVNNIRRAISRDPLVAEYLKAQDEMFEFMNRGERAEMQGEIHIEGDDVIEHEGLEGRLATLPFQMLRLFPTSGPYSPCWCGSGKKVK